MKNEITVKAFFLSIFLSIILSSAMTYLGLYAGMTISASIPAAIMSMGILRLFKESNILENNIVQTAASAGESLDGPALDSSIFSALRKCSLGFIRPSTTPRLITTFSTFSV